MNTIVRTYRIPETGKYRIIALTPDRSTEYPCEGREFETEQAALEAIGTMYADKIWKSEWIDDDTLQIVI